MIIPNALSLQISALNINIIRFPFLYLIHSKIKLNNTLSSCRLKNEIEDLKTQNTKLKADLASRPSEEESKKISSSSIQEDNRIEDLKASHEKELSSLKTKVRNW